MCKYRYDHVSFKIQILCQFYQILRNIFVYTQDDKTYDYACNTQRLLLQFREAKALGNEIWFIRIRSLCIMY